MLRQRCSDRRLSAAIDFLLAFDLRQQFRTEALSRHLNLSTSRVHHLFHEHFGFSPGQVLKLRRMQEARELLDSTFKSVKEVMVAVGLNDLSHFVRDFKQAFGKSPSELRRERSTGSNSNEDGEADGTAEGFVEAC
jgi:AraC-like DNA-binding protein